MAVAEMYKINFGKVVEEVKFDNVRIYTAEEIASNPVLVDYKISDKDILFEVQYDLKIIDGYENIIEFTAANGEIDGNWVVNKSNIGIARYVSDGEYNIENWGTGL